jgi:hypothetical protein
VNGANGPGQSIPITDFTPLNQTEAVVFPAGVAEGGFGITVTCAVQNVFGITALSTPTPVKVVWDPALLADPVVQAALVQEKSDQAIAQVRARLRTALPPQQQQ